MTPSADSKTNWLLPAAICLLFLFLVYISRRVLTPFFIAFILAYLLDPIVDRLEARKLSRGPATVALLLAFFILCSAVIALLFPLLRVQAENFVKNLPEYVAVVQGWIQPLLERLAGLDQEKAQAILKEGLARFGELPMKIVTSSSEFLWNSLSGLFNMILMAANLIIIPVAMFYLLRDFDDINQRVLNLVPERHRKRTLAVFKEIDATLAGFVRGQLLVVILMGALYCIGLFLCGAPMSLFIGMMAGIANLVPYLGLILGFVPAAVMTFAHTQDWLSVLGVAGVFAVVQALEGMVITPRVVGESIGLHPVIIMAAVLLGAEFFGFAGIILAVPAAAVINVLAKQGLKVYKESDFFKVS
ncbi:MAG: AI-2E family transporter [Candidatus Nitrohelix vancouverensis]|uniref:AI-2E family transporter n=1 Tax=Candidatus Nitrohelix vancouverensis TaxID=2705534 RepID=A0A7T0G337_9BACT|nr:MAG: AI-2E family transporter [Candidatus Nitrohelix vancouverensis]